MQEISFEKLIRREEPGFETNVGRGSNGSIDKTACFYHVITKSFDGGRIFYRDIAEYRHNLLCHQCQDKGIKILFSVTMSNHTHDVFLVPSWEALSEVMRIVNKNVTQQLHIRYPKRVREGVRAFRRYPAYIPVRDVVQLFCLGKYIFDNPSYLEHGNRSAPNSCFWMFESDFFVAAYDRDLFIHLFGLSPKEIFSIYSEMDGPSVTKYAVSHFGNWTEKQTRAVFYK